jgi:ComF family protein
LHCGNPLIDKSIGDLYCVNCLNKKDNLRYSRSAVIYDVFSKKLILDFKFFDHIENKKLLAQWMYLAGKDIFDAGVDVIIPIPLHKLRLLKRKYNQSAILASELSKMTNIKSDYKSFVKIRSTQPQSECSGKKRITNIKNAFTVKNPENIKGKRILLIDDVYTTGSTLRECAKVLKKAGAKSVDALTIAKVC